MENDVQRKHIGELDGIRALAIIIIVWYHFWQQSWITPSIGIINLDLLIRNGSILVDMMVFLSAFCLFLPYARQMVYGEKVASIKQFYINRVARIAPSYYISILLILFLFVIPNKEYSSIGSLLKDFFAHAFFINNWFIDTLAYTKLNGVLWTVSLEVQYYLIFPLLAKAFMKRPKTTYISLIIFGLLSSMVISQNFGNLDQVLYTNHAFTFASVYANGMMGAWIYMLLTKKQKRTAGNSIFYTLITLVSIYLFLLLCHARRQYISETRWQVDYRFVLSTVYLIFTIGSLMSVKLWRRLFDNRIAKFISEISFNLYIYHQYIAVKLKELRIPMWEGEVPPNMTGDAGWQWKYFLLCIGISLIVACVMTYCVEKPLAKIIKKKFSQVST